MWIENDVTLSYSVAQHGGLTGVFILYSDCLKRNNYLPIPSLFTNFEQMWFSVTADSCWINWIIRVTSARRAFLQSLLAPSTGVTAKLQLYSQATEDQIALHNIKINFVGVYYLVYSEGDISEASLLCGIFHQLPVHGPELVKLIYKNKITLYFYNCKVSLW